jgi:hypothetical protein
MQNYLIPSALGLFLFTTTPVLALDGNKLNIPHDQWLSPTEIVDRLSAQGYKVREIEADDGAYEVEMVDKNGTHVDVYVHPATAELLPGYDD